MVSVRRISPSGSFISALYSSLHKQLSCPRIIECDASGVIISCLLLFLTIVFLDNCQSLGVGETNFGKVFVSPFGRDANNCGAEVRPCQTIAQAVRQVTWGGVIYLNGSGSENLPFNCSFPGIHLNKSLSITGFLSPNVNCIGGLYFQKAHNQPQIHVKLSEIIFWQTSLFFQDCQKITIVNCTFREATVAINVQLQNLTTFYLDISGDSLFHNNSLCIDLLFLENVMNRERQITVNINDVRFERNGFHGGPHRGIHRGGLRFASKERSGTFLEQINVSCNNVKYVDSNGSFVDIYVANASTKEIYTHVELVSNDRTPYSLYFSNAKQLNVQFIRLRCLFNPSTRCIRIQSNKAEVKIYHSLFYKIFQPLWFDSKINGSLKIFNSSFIYNNARFGGSLLATSRRGHMTINITNVIFRYCKARYGCVMAIGKPSTGKGQRYKEESIPDELYFTLKNVTVEKWNGKSSKCTAIHVLHKGGTVMIEDSRFNKKIHTSVDGAVEVMTTGGKSNITISNCSFVDKSITKRKGIALKIASWNGNAGTVAILNSLFISSEKKQTAMFLNAKYRIKLINSTMMSFRYGFKVFSSNTKNSTFPIDIYVDKCTFMNNAHDMLLTLFNPTSVQVTIQNTLFTSNETILQNSYAIRFNIPPLNNVTCSNAVIELVNDTFESAAASNFVLFFKGEKSVNIRHCIFRNCTYAYPEVQKWSITENDENEFYETGSGAISILTLPDKPKGNGCLRSNTISDTHPLWHYESHITFEDTAFEQNLGLIVGGIHISNGYTTFKRCVFRDNFALQQSGHIYSAYGTGQVDLQDCIFSRTVESIPGPNRSSYIKANFLYSQSGGPVNLKNTSMISVVPAKDGYRMLDISSGGYFYMDQNTTIQCSIGSKLLFEDATHIVYTEKSDGSCVINNTVLRYSCQSCSSGYYSLQKGTSRGLLLNSTVSCLKCPFGASCIKRNIAAKPNFWGSQTSNPQKPLQFIACPEHYCQRPLPDSRDFNRCYGRRNGTLCGRCAEGFTESLFSTECSKTTECNHYWFWVMTITYTLGLALYLLIKPPILSFLGHQILWYRRQENQVRSDSHEDSESGFLEITFYFYQVAELLMRTSMESRLKLIPFLDFVISAFNFQVTTVNDNIGCPFPGLTAVTKEVFLSGTVFLTMANVFVVYCVHVCTNFLRKKEKPKFSHYMAVVLEILLLGYESLAEMSLKLMHCVSIGSGKRLFVDGNVPCLQWWQYILLVYIAVFVVPFTLVIYWGSSKLYKSSIKSNEFLAACVLPLPFLIYWFFQDICKRRVPSYFTRNREANKDVLEVLHGPFRSPSDVNKGAIYWVSVLIGRRLVLLTCHTFIVDPMLRGVCMTSACFIMTIHHIFMNPYRDPMANKAETLSLAVLTLIAAINLPGEALFSFGIDMNTDPPNTAYLEAVKWIEVGALAFIPAFVSLLVTFAFLSQLTRFGAFLSKYIRTAYQYRASGWIIEENSLLTDMGEPNTHI